MITNLEHELAVLEAFFAREAAWVDGEYARLASLPGASERSSEAVEDELFHPEGPGPVHDLICRIAVNELNALVETSLRQALLHAYGVLLPGGAKGKRKTVYRPTRADLEKTLLELGVGLTDLPAYDVAQQIREIAEGNKHRERLRPLPEWKNETEGFINQQRGAGWDWSACRSI